jgi:hypothetical protein
VKTINTQKKMKDMKSSNSLKLQTLALAACLFASAATLKAQTTTTTNLTVVDIRATDPYALEGTSTASFTLLRHGDTNAALDVALSFSGSGSNGVDYQTVSNTVTIPAGFLAVDIPITPIVVNTGNKTVTFTVETNSSYVRGFHRSATVHIIDDTFNDPLPTVTITSPTNGSTFSAPATITVMATASDPDFNISSVSFFADDLFLGRATNSPFSVTVTNVHAGHYEIFSRALDTAGQSAFSTPVSVSVTNTNSTRPFPVGPFGR